MAKIKTFFRKLADKYRNSNIVFKASIWFIAVTVIDKSISVLTQPFVNRILTVEEVGVYGVFQAWYLIMTVVATFNLFGGVLEVYLTKDKENTNRFVSSLSFLSLVISLTVFGIVAIFINPISTFLGLKPLYIVIMFLTIIGEMLIQFWAVTKRFQYSYKAYSFLTVGLFLSKSILTVVLSYTFTEDRVLGRVLGLCIPSLVMGIILFITILKKNRPTVSYWKKALLFNLPLIPHYLCTILLSSSDRFMLEKLSTLTDTGLYTVAYSFSSLSLIVFTAINNAFNPYSMKCIKNGEYKSLSKSTNIVIVFSILFSIILIYLAPEGLYILGGQKYMAALNIIPILVLGIFFSSFYFIFSNVEFVYEKNKMVFPITFLGAAINILLNYFWIPMYGYTAAAYTTLIGYLFIALCHYIVSVIILKKNIYNIWFILGALLVFTGLSFLGLVLYEVHFAIRLSAAGLVIVAFIVFGVLYRKRLFSKNHSEEQK